MLINEATPEWSAHAIANIFLVACVLLHSGLQRTCYYTAVSARLHAVGVIAVSAQTGSFLRHIATT